MRNIFNSLTSHVTRQRDRAKGTEVKTRARLYAPREFFFFFHEDSFLINLVISVLIRFKFKSTYVCFVTESPLQGTLLK